MAGKLLLKDSSFLLLCVLCSKDIWGNYCSKETSAIALKLGGFHLHGKFSLLTLRYLSMEEERMYTDLGYSFWEISYTHHSSVYGRPANHHAFGVEIHALPPIHASTQALHGNLLDLPESLVGPDCKQQFLAL